MSKRDTLAIPRVASSFDGRVHVPGSKSMTNRALLIAALASGRSRLENVLISDDTRYMIDALTRVGIPVTVDTDTRTIIVEGNGGAFQDPGEPLFVGNSGTCMRFLASTLALGRGEFVLDGTPRMRERPIKDLIDGLQHLGVHIESIPGNGCPPVRITGKGIRGGPVTVKGSASSQYISSILLAAPLASETITITIDGTLVSRPYVTMTTRMMEAAGARVWWEADNVIAVQPAGAYAAGTSTIESDFSSASYFMAAAALTGSRVELVSFSRESMQADAGFVDIVQQMGARARQEGDVVHVHGTGTLHAVDVDLFECSDLVPTVAVLAAFADGTTRITNVENIRIKESDRILAVATELRKMGIKVIEHRDGLDIEGKDRVQPATIETYDDHRIAMAFSVAGLKTGEITIKDPGCVAKTYPTFFQDLFRLCGTG